jgi:glycosyltransferase involved in cell wall biosynthesis
MRIALATWELAPPYGLGGVSRYVNRLANSLCELGNEVTIYFARGYDTVEDSDLFEVRRIPVSNAPVVKIFEFSSRLNKMLAQEKPDVLNVHIPQFLWSMRCDYPVVLTIHTTASGEARGISAGGFRSLADLARYVVFTTVDKAMERSAVRHADRIIVVNESIGAEVSKLHSFPAEHILHITPAMEPKNLARSDKQVARRRFGLDDDDFVILFVGRLESRKNPLVLLEGFNTALGQTHRSLKLLFCGDGSHREILASRIKSLRLEGKVLLLGRVDDSTLSLAYSASDLYVLPSVVEGYPATIVESRYFGLPVVVGNFPGVGSTVTNGKDGVVLDSIDRDSVARSILDLSNDSTLYASLKGGFCSSSAPRNWGETAVEMNELFKLLA